MLIFFTRFCILSSCYDNYHIIHTFTMVLLDWVSSKGFLRLCVTQKHNLILPFYNYLSTLTVLPARSVLVLRFQSTGTFPFKVKKFLQNVAFRLSVFRPKFRNVFNASDREPEGYVLKKNFELVNALLRNEIFNNLR